MAITNLPTPPARSDTPANFITKADAFIAALPNFVTEANAQAAALTLNATTDSSVTSNVIGLGSKTFTVSTGKSFQPGMYLVIADTAAPSTNSMSVQVTSYNSGTGALVVNSLAFSGSGTFTAWVISQTAVFTPLDNSVSTNKYVNASVTQPKLGANVAGTGPAFSAYASVSQSVASATPTKVTLGTENFDTNNNFAASRFTPTVAGYYHFDGTIRISGTTISINIADIFKNGALEIRGDQRGSGSSNDHISVAGLIFCNGTTDFIELYGTITATTPSFNFFDATITSRLIGHLVRAA